MYVLSNYTFTPDVSNGYDKLVVPGVYGIERFVSIENATRNDVLYSATGDHLGSIIVSDDGVQTTVLIYTAATDNSSEASDKIRILIYDPTPTGSGPSSNVTVTNWPASQNINGVVSISGEVEVKNDTGNPLEISGTVDVGNFPATQTVDGTVDVGNFPATQTVDGTVDVGNFPATQTVDGTVDIGNFPATQPISGSVSVSNFPATQTVDGTVTANQGTDPWNVAGTVTSNQGTSPWISSITNFPATQTVDGTVDVGNFPATQAVTGTVTANQGTSPWVVSGTTTSTVSAFPATSTDAFNRLRVSQPFTMFDSSHRYADNGLWSTQTASGGTAIFIPTEGLVDLSVDGTLGSKVYRETTKVFSYQPGKSLLVDNTFVMNAPLAGLRQRAGYFNTENGYFLETDDLNIYFVERSLSTGTETRVPQALWNVDPMLNGTGPSGITLDISKAQIFWMDLQWLGEGTVRMGFEIDGQAYLCHQWNHANLISSTYITTASLPLRIEIENTASTGLTSTLKQVCSTVISEGGYTLAGLQQAVGTPITAPYALAVAGTIYPLVSIRLKTTRLDAVVILSAISLMGNGNNEKFQWRVIASATTTGGSWVSAGANSSVEYNLTGTATSGGRVLASGYTSSSNQGSPTIDILKQALFAFQLERDPFTATPYELTIALAGAGTSTTAYASMDWEEISR